MALKQNMMVNLNLFIISVITTVILRQSLYGMSSLWHEEIHIPKKVNISQWPHEGSFTYDFQLFGQKGVDWHHFADKWFICLATHAKVSQLHMIADQIETWDGPISVGVMVSDIDYFIAIEMINYLQTCFIEVRKRVSFHFASHVNKPPSYIPPNPSEKYDCSRPKVYNNKLMQRFHRIREKNELDQIPYNHNFLLNLARLGCMGNYTLTIDIDMFVAPTIDHQINWFLTSRNVTEKYGKAAFVIPAFEILSDVNFPRDKKELAKLMKNYEATSYLGKRTSPGRLEGVVQQWLESPPTNMDAIFKIGFNLNDFLPFFLVDHEAEFLDERLVEFEFERYVQAVAMELAGYKWFALNNAFLCHRGLRTDSIMRQKTRLQRDINRANYNVIIRDMAEHWTYNLTDILLT